MLLTSLTLLTPPLEQANQSWGLSFQKEKHYLGPVFRHLNNVLYQKVIKLFCFVLFDISIYRVNGQPADQKFPCLATEASTKPQGLFWHRKNSFYLVKIPGDDVSVAIFKQQSQEKSSKETTVKRRKLPKRDLLSCDVQLKTKALIQGTTYIKCL